MLKCDLFVVAKLALLFVLQKLRKVPRVTSCRMLRERKPSERYAADAPHLSTVITTARTVVCDMQASS